MLSVVDINTFGLNLYLIIGALVFCGLAFMFFIAAWTTVNSIIWLIQRRCAERAYRKVTFRADGEKYPGFLEGVCGECHRGGRKIYFPFGTDKELCPTCYDRYWRREAAGLTPEAVV